MSNVAVRDTNTNARIKRTIIKTLEYLALLLACFIALLPIWSSFTTSFKSAEEYAVTNAMALPQNWLNFGNYVQVWTEGDMLRAFLTSAAVVVVVVTVSVMMGSMLAYKEKTLKKRLAYSTVSQVSYILFGILLVSPEGFYGGLLQLVFHAIAKNGLFMAAGGIIYHLYKTRVNQLQGAGLKLPYIMWCFALYSLSLIGIPPTAGFVSKWYLAQGGLHFGVLGMVGTVVLMISALLTAGYLLPIVADAFFPGDHFDREVLHEPQKQHLNWHMRAPMLVLVGGCLLLGTFPNALDWLTEPIMALLFS